MRRLVAMGMAVLLLAGCSGVHLRRSDCTSPGEYLAHNGQTLRALGSVGVTIAGAVLGQMGSADPGALAYTPPTWLSFAVKPKVGIDYLGLGLSVARNTIFAGGSLTGLLNQACALACCEVVIDRPPSIAMDVGTAGVVVEGAL